MLPQPARPPGPSGRYSRARLSVHWGPGSLDAIGADLVRSGATRAVIVTSRWVAACPGLLAQLTEAADGRVAGTFAGAREHSPLDAVLAAAAELSRHRADAIIAAGGGSVMVTARAANILHGEGRPADELATRWEQGRFTSPRLAAPKLPVYAVPTTPTTAAGKAGSALTQPGSARRLALFDPRSRARLIAVHPGFLATAPAELVLSASLNALCMAIEGLLSVSANAWSDALLTYAARRLVELLDPRTAPAGQPGCPALDGAAPDGTGLDRVALALAAIMAGDGSDTARGGVGAALSHVAGHRTGVPNGVIEAVLLPHVLGRVDPRHPGRRAAAAALGAASAEQAPAAAAALLRRLGMPERLREAGIGEADLPRLAAAAVSDFAVASAPGEPGGPELLALLQTAW